MKISSDTLSVLQNYAVINNGILVKEGNVVRTISTQKTLLSKATVTETFPKDFCIYDLSQFLGTVSLFDDPDFEFGDNAVTISSGNTKLKYVYAEPNTIITPPDKQLDTSGEIVFKLSSDHFSQLTKAANVLSVPNLVITEDDGSIVATATDVKNTTSNEFSVRMSDGGSESGDFKMVLKIENLKLIPDDYDVCISSKGIAFFSGTKADYWVAVGQKDSVYKS